MCKNNYVGAFGSVENFHNLHTLKVHDGCKVSSNKREMWGVIFGW